MTGRGQARTPDLGDELGDFGDKSEIPENAIIFSISLLGEEVRVSAFHNRRLGFIAVVIRPAEQRVVEYRPKTHMQLQLPLGTVLRSLSSPLPLTFRSFTDVSPSSCSAPATIPQDPDGFPRTHPLPPTTETDNLIPRTEIIQHHQRNITGDLAPCRGPYRSVMGCLAFIASRTRPDINYAINLFSQFQSNPGVVHWSGLMKLLGYLQATRNYKLDIGNIAEISLTAYSDADFASCTDDRISVGGHIVFCGNVPVSWRTAKQKSVTLSSMEAEFLSICETAKELMWLKNVLGECQSTNVLLGDISCKLLSDNMAAIQFSKSSIENNRTKHIDVKFHFVRNLLNLKVFKLLYVNTKMNIADIFTKAQTKLQLNKFNEKLFKN
ncbi:Retrovirus-related Pol polyprotein from transposon RE2 [Araneus ventricosus]|uniref:Retrovirus-related Pol polyprotein from transposon RE2 n=1 Tax=Araneus ventricosus TaxID=182803 RepID=A0A4Y2SQ44_ARAVE|nr:Retrovirus-related Pol polyprotein from transposon RE2 [Araneus ventricosus]